MRTTEFTAHLEALLNSENTHAAVTRTSIAITTDPHTWEIGRFGSLSVRVGDSDPAPCLVRLRERIAFARFYRRAWRAYKGANRIEAIRIINVALEALGG